MYNIPSIYPNRFRWNATRYGIAAAVQGFTLARTAEQSHRDRGGEVTACTRSRARAQRKLGKGHHAHAIPTPPCVTTAVDTGPQSPSPVDLIISSSLPVSHMQIGLDHKERKQGIFFLRKTMKKSICAYYYLFINTSAQKSCGRKSKRITQEEREPSSGAPSASPFASAAPRPLYIPPVSHLFLLPHFPSHHHPSTSSLPLPRAERKASAASAHLLLLPCWIAAPSS